MADALVLQRRLPNLEQLGLDASHNPWFEEDEFAAFFSGLT